MPNKPVTIPRSSIDWFIYGGLLSQQPSGLGSDRGAGLRIATSVAQRHRPLVPVPICMSRPLMNPAQCNHVVTAAVGVGRRRAGKDVL
jgi:hypothetical protein